MKDKKYILMLAGSFLLLIAVEFFAPRPIDWTVTFAKGQKSPNAGFVLNKVLSDVFPSGTVTNSDLPLFDLVDDSDRNYLIIAQQFTADEFDSDKILTAINQGASLMLATSYGASDLFSDTLDFKIGITDREQFITSTIVLDTMVLRVRGVKEDFIFLASDVGTHFATFDSTAFTPFAWNQFDQVVAIERELGDGKIVITTAAMAFVNQYLIKDNNYRFASAMLNHLPDRDLVWTEYYQLGRYEPRTPLRFVLSSIPLRWAYFTVLISLVLFVIFEAKRKQRIIPIITPLRNTSVDFVKAVGNLYFEKKNHKNMTSKKIKFLLEHIRTHLRLKTNTLDDEFIEHLVNKTGKDRVNMEGLVNMINILSRKTEVTGHELIILSKKIDAFYKD